MTLATRTAIAIAGFLLLIFSPLSLEIAYGVRYFHGLPVNLGYAATFACPATTAAVGAGLILLSHRRPVLPAPKNPLPSTAATPIRRL